MWRSETPGSGYDVGLRDYLSLFFWSERLTLLSCAGIEFAKIVGTIRNIHDEQVIVVFPAHGKQANIRRVDL